MQLIMVRWCGVLGAEQCWVVAFLGLNSAGWSYGPPIEDFCGVTSHAQSTAATYLTGAVKSDVVHLIVV